MCLVKKINLYTKLFGFKARVAKKDLTVYKWLIDTRISLRGPCYRDYEYKIGRSNVNVTLCPDICIGYFRIEKGYHSYTTKKGALKSSILEENKGLFKCIIPKGTKYIKDNYYCMVSETIIIQERLIEI
jgi:hypothetical protein